MFIIRRRVVGAQCHAAEPAAGENVRAVGARLALDWLGCVTQHHIRLYCNT